MLCFLLLVTYLSAMSALSSIFLSRYSGVNGPPLITLVRSLIGDSLSTATLCYIPTASYAFSPTSLKSRGEQRRRARYDAKGKAKLLSDDLGLEGESIVMEIDDPVKWPKEKIHQAISASQLVYLEGGETYYLQRYLIESQFWSIARPLMEEQSILLMGASAGGICSGTSITTAEWKGWDKPEIAGEDFEWNSERQRGAALADYKIFPHYVPDNHDAIISERQASADEKVVCIQDHEICVNIKDRESFMQNLEGDMYPLDLR